MANTTKLMLQPFGTNLRPLKSDDDLDIALAEMEALWLAEEGTPEGDRLEVLATLIEAYEEKHYPMDPPDPIAAIRFRLEQQGLETSALIGVIGSRTRVYEVLRGDRPLSLEMIRRLHAKFGIPADILIQPAKRPRRKRAA
jgi:HTH-type transcriptional regulator/antitoxin HigA